MTRRVACWWVLSDGTSAATEAGATMGGGSSRVPMTDFLIELYNVTNGIYIPLLSRGALAFGAANLLFGFMRFGPVIGRIFGVVGILGLGVTWFAQSVGASVRPQPGVLGKSD